jgi:hypothetical protein
MSILTSVPGGKPSSKATLSGRDQGITFGQSLGGIAHGIQTVGDIPHLAADASHLDDAGGVIGDRAEGVHRQDEGTGHEHAHGCDRGAEDTAVNMN